MLHMNPLWINIFSPDDFIEGGFSIEFKNAVIFHKEQNKIIMFNECHYI